MILRPATWHARAWCVFLMEGRGWPPSDSRRDRDDDRRFEAPDRWRPDDGRRDRDDGRRDRDDFRRDRDDGRRDDRWRIGGNDRYDPRRDEPRRDGPSMPPRPPYSGYGGGRPPGNARVPEPVEEFGYVVPKDVLLDPNQEGRIVAIQAKAGWEVRPKGQTAGNQPRTGSGGGFREFDREAEDSRRKQRAIDEKNQVQERKAGKVKCAFCHRASCIC